MYGPIAAQVVRDLMTVASGRRVDGLERLMRNGHSLAEQLEGKPHCDGEAKRRRTKRKNRAGFCV